MQVVADAGPLNYLILIDAIDVLPQLFGSIMLPEAVASELRHPRAPERVRLRMTRPPSWVASCAASAGAGELEGLDAGERAAIALAIARRADLVLMDDRAGVLAARSLGLKTVGTIGVLDRAAMRGIIDLEDAVSRLRRTNFRGSPTLFEALLRRPSGPGG